MFRSFCDICNVPCQRDKTTRRFEHLVGSLDGKFIGVEIITLYDGEPSTDRHVCDVCLLNLIWVMAERSPGTGLALKQKSLQSREQACQNLLAELAAKKDELAASDASLKSREEQISAREQEVTDQVRKEYEEKITFLEGQIQTIKDEHTRHIKLVTAQVRQELADEKSYPEYVNRVANREKIRRS